jgi:hypothetical protein
MAQAAATITAAINLFCAVIMRLLPRVHDDTVQASRPPRSSEGDQAGVLNRFML